MPPLNFGPEVQYFDKELIFLSLLSFKMRKGCFSRKISKVICTVLPENEVCASCRHRRAGGTNRRIALALDTSEAV